MRRIPLQGRLVAVMGVAFFLSACNGNSGFSSSPGLPGTYPQSAQAPVARIHRHASSNKIQHVVIIVQENRSFNNLFYGYPGARTQKYGYDSSNQKIRLEPIGLETSWDIDHSSGAFFAACDGVGSIPGTNCRMNGFDQEYVGCGHSSQPSCPYQHPQYAYVPHTETAPYFAMAQQFVLADEMYASNFDASSFISHQYIISAQAESAVNYPGGWWGCPGGPSDSIATVGPQRQIPYGYEVPCWDPTTLGDELDKASLPWAFYTSVYYDDGGIWSAYQAINHIYLHSDWYNDIITPQTQFFTDVSNGNLRTVSWITPTCANSDHAGCGSNTGPAWVASLVNAIGESQYWDSTAIVILWDDYGGWYDREPPAYKDYDGLGLRIPMLVISAYSKKPGLVSHTHYEHGSILKFIEDQFGLPRLAASDKRAKSIKDVFDFSQSPRAFVAIPSARGKNYFMHQAPDMRPPDSE